MYGIQGSPLGSILLRCLSKNQYWGDAGRTNPWSLYHIKSMFVPSLEEQFVPVVPAPGADGDGSTGGSEDEVEGGPDSKVSTRVKKSRRPLSRRVPRFLYLSS